MVAANKYQARHHQFTGRKAWQGRQSPQAKLIAAYEHKIEYLQQEIEQKDKRIEELESQLAKAKKNSRTSSKPPSSDIVKKKQAEKKSKGKRRKGGQKGHKKHEREPFSEDQIKDCFEYSIDTCPDCGHMLEAMTDKEPKVIQQVEVKKVLVEVNEHRGLPFWCEHCQKVHYAALPQEIERAGLIGPELTAHIAYWKGFGHLSYSALSKCLAEIYGIPGKPLSTGFLVKLVQKVSHALFHPYKELEAMLALQEILNIDETGHKHNGKPYWTWCFRAELFTFFHIADTRGTEVLFDLLGREFAGIIGCDLFSAYKKFMAESCAMVQFCLAHLIRDIRYLTTLPDKVTKNYAERLLDRVRDLFKVIHRREAMTTKRFGHKLKEIKKTIIATAKRAPNRTDARRLAKRFREYGEQYFTFITTPGLEPTNNLAEQAIRFVVLDRKVSQGTRSPRGDEWCERIWTTIATCKQQGISVFEFIRDAIYADFTGQAAPSLLRVDSS